MYNTGMPASPSLDILVKSKCVDSRTLVKRPERKRGIARHRHNIGILGAMLPLPASDRRDGKKGWRPRLWTRSEVIRLSGEGRRESLNDWG
jgi:hypothetical protein